MHGVVRDETDTQLHINPGLYQYHDVLFTMIATKAARQVGLKLIRLKFYLNDQALISKEEQC